MIRPITLICVIMAIGSGLFLYQSKHSVLLLDRQIEKIVRETDGVRENIRSLHAEWMVLNDPERLRQYSDRYLALKPVAPTQFTSLNDLATKLPAPRAPEPEPKEPVVDTQFAATAPDRPRDAAGLPIVAAEPAPPIEAEEVLPIPPIPVPPPPAAVAAVAAVSRPEARPAPAPAPRPTASVQQTDLSPVRPPLQAQEARPSRPPESRAVEARVADARPAAPPPRPAPIQAAPIQATPIQATPVPTPVVATSRPVTQSFQPLPAPTPYTGGSLLGAAGGGGGLPPPLPRPTPIQSSSPMVGGG